ncbi:RNA pseudouridylate synthase [Fragilaria crotonensis]|nr:RNA pseudouridylate synthase [Fragilaria crotonensis]
MKTHDGNVLVQRSGDCFIRSVPPYVHTYYTHVKARWTGKSVLDVYCNEFGGYSEQYYEAAIQTGKILLSDKRISPHHVLENGQDVLSHTIHLHEPDVIMEHPDIIIIAETDELVVVDKPSTMVVHPTGSSRYNSLQTILELRFDRKLYTIHRLDRVTSGICMFAKFPETAKKWSNLESGEVHKYYVARVKGKFPLCFNANAMPRLPLNKNGVKCGVYTTETTLERRKRNAFGYWTSRESLQAIFDAQEPMESWLDNCSDSHWLHFACPTRVAQHKHGVCRAGSFDDLPDDIYKCTVKASQTSFGVVSYCVKTDSTLVVCKPSTGRSHQIRVHLQFLGHPIATDTTYGGDQSFANPAGRPSHDEALATLTRQQMDTECCVGESVERRKDEGLEEFVARACAMCREENSGITRPHPKSHGIWLRALKYQMMTNSPSGEIMSYTANPPAWVDV